MIPVEFWEGELVMIIYSHKPEVLSTYTYKYCEGIPYWYSTYSGKRWLREGYENVRGHLQDLAKDREITYIPVTEWELEFGETL